VTRWGRGGMGAVVTKSGQGICVGPVLRPVRASSDFDDSETGTFMTSERRVCLEGPPPHMHLAFHMLL